MQFATNPILPLQHFIPDVEAHVWADGRIYLYGSMDIPTRDRYCCGDYHVFSETIEEHEVAIANAPSGD